MLHKILLVSLIEPPPNDCSTVYLELTAIKLLSEGETLLLSCAILILINRLSTLALQAPFPFFISAFGRTQDELRKVASMKDIAVQSEIELAIKQACKMVLFYCQIHVGNPNMFAPPDWSPLLSTTQLLPLNFLNCVIG